MSAILSTEDLQPVADLIERVQNVQRAITDLHEAREQGADYYVTVSQKPDDKEVPVAHTHRLPYFVVLQGLAAMERELRNQLDEHEITVESVLPIAEVA